MGFKDCHGDFAVVWSKLIKYFTKNLACNMKLLLHDREENIKVFLLGRTSTIISFHRLL